MGIFDWILLTLFLGSFVGSCASLGAAPAAAQADPLPEPKR